MNPKIYERLASEIDRIQSQYILDSQDSGVSPLSRHEQYRHELAEILARYGVTENEWETELERRVMWRMWKLNRRIGSS